MRIDFEKLRDAGWHVDADKDGVTVYGQEPMPEMLAMVKALQARGLATIESEVLVDDFFGRVEGRLILAALER